MSGKSTTNRILWTVLAVALIGIGIYALNDYLRSQELTAPTRTLPNYGAVPAFTLTTQDSTQFSLADLKGKIWISDLIFTHCGGTCPMLSARMSAVQSSLEKIGDDVKLVSFTVDPNNDTPPVMKDYAKHYRADPKRWTFLTGNVATIFSVARDGFHLSVDSAHEDAHEPIVHSERFVLVDRNANIRGYYDGTADDAEAKLLTDLGDLLREDNKK
ncbi:MAG TPA: SCO family protein [Candidatus Kapabacteria bacterium]|nr:SCO family protein [Candidatus Kapabacteria bacterium]